MQLAFNVAQASRLPWPQQQPGWMSDLGGISCPPSGWGQPAASATGETPVLFPEDVAVRCGGIVPAEADSCRWFGDRARLGRCLPRPRGRPDAGRPPHRPVPPSAPGPARGRTGRQPRRLCSPPLPSATSRHPRRSERGHSRPRALRPASRRLASHWPGGGAQQRHPPDRIANASPRQGSQYQPHAIAPRCAGPIGRPRERLSRDHATCSGENGQLGRSRRQLAAELRHEDAPTGRYVPGEPDAAGW